MGTLRTIAAAQEQFKQQTVVDQDADGMGEYGWLGELCGTQPVRGSGLKMSLSPFIATSLGVKDEGGRSQKSDFYYRMFLQRPDGRWMAEPLRWGFDQDGRRAMEVEQAEEAAAIVAKEFDSEDERGAALEAMAERHARESTRATGQDPAAADLQEQRWVCYAWPISVSQSGIRCFVANEQGDVWQCNNVKTESGHDPYVGTANMPMATAAFGASGKTFAVEDLGERGRDGRFWHPSH